MSQIALPLDWPEHERDEEFLVFPPNADAVRLLERRAVWPTPVALLTGPPRSGRSLLGRLWAHATGGRLIDDAPRLHEDELFHAWNRATALAEPLLLVADLPPPGWAVALPDLHSRLAATVRAQIGPPDDALLRALLDRGLARRGLLAPPRVLGWLLPRIERSYVGVEAVVDALDRAALSRARALTLPLAREALGAAITEDEH